MLPRASSLCVDVRSAARASEHAHASVVTSLVPPGPLCDVTDLAELMQRELPRSAAGESAERDGTEANAHEAIDVEIERFTEPPNLARTSLGDRDLEFPFATS